MKCLEPGKVLKHQVDKNKTLMLISLLLMKVATLYQIPNWGEGQSLILADWIFQTYQFDKLESILKTLNNPPIGDDKNWRLTPDTIQAWIAIELENEAGRREKEIYNAKQKPIPDNDVDLLLIEALGPKIDEPAPETTHHQDAGKKLVPLTQEEIEKMGKEEPYKKIYHSEHVDEVRILSEKKMQYGRECTDLLTGKRLSGAPSFDEWLILPGEKQ